MTDLTPEEQEALALMREIVAEKGADHVYEPRKTTDEYGDLYEECVYFNGDGSPSCIAGHFIARKGWRDSVSGSLEGTASDAIGLPISDRMNSAIRKAQEAQDAGKTWGEALEAFETCLGVTA